MNEENQLPSADLPEQIRQLEAIGVEMIETERHADAERIFREIARVSPRHVSALQYLGNRAMQSGALEEAQELYERAVYAAPGMAAIHQQLGLVLSARGYPDGALRAFDTVIRLEPAFASGWILRGAVLQELGRREEAVAMYQQAETLCSDLLEFALARSGLSGMHQQILQASHHLAYTRSTAVKEALERLQARGLSTPTERVAAAIRHMCRQEPAAYANAQQHPAYAYVPGLGERPLFADGKFPWADRLERRTGAICNEFHALLDAGLEPTSNPEKDGLHPAAAFYLYFHGRRTSEITPRCPQTIAELNALPLLAKLPGQAPEASFSILPPRARLAPRTGIANYKLKLLLPLSGASGGTLRVDDRSHPLTDGKSVLYDDCYEHEIRNRGETELVMLLADLWHPGLTGSEVKTLTAAHWTLEHLRSKLDAVIRAAPGSSSGVNGRI
ncbi:MAG: aspartyl/asparaginyl beta-hydroxylase domain-containing protein [Gammaproteobacteria bacterium]|nr:aspartyl/asparaginyl beta-hydroxylase domain-containing protein [Gammaproteobacteria bacterium]